MIALALWPNISMADVSGPIQVSLNISKFPIINETTNVSLKVVSIYDAPNTTAEIILPNGCILSRGEILRTLDLRADSPEFLNASMKFTQGGDFKIEANAVHVTGPNAGWVDSDTIFLTIGTNMSYPTPDPIYGGELEIARTGNGTQAAAKVSQVTLAFSDEFNHNISNLNISNCNSIVPNSTVPIQDEVSLTLRSLQDPLGIEVPQVLSPVIGNLEQIGPTESCSGTKWCFNQHQSGGHLTPGICSADDKYAWDANLNTPTFDSDNGKPVYAVASGTVSQTYGGCLNTDGTYGQVLIEHSYQGSTWWSGYLHLDPILVKRGQAVTVNTIIGYISDKGANNNHLHFVVYTGKNGNSNLKSFGALITPRSGAITAPTVTNNNGATFVTTNSARLNGEITNTGGENPLVTVYAGPSDGDTNPGSWAVHTNPVQLPLGSFYSDYTSLSPGTRYYYRCYAENSAGASWASSTATFTTHQNQNRPPNTPSPPSGSTAGNPGTSYSYSTSATDPDGDQVKYTFSWDDGTTNTQTGLVASGTSASLPHTWSTAGTYYVQAMATDSKGATSGWSSATIVTINTNPNTPPIVALRAANGQYVCAEGSGGGAVVSNRNAISAWETFKLINRGNGNVALQAANGQYLCAEGSGGGAVVANRNVIGAWETFKLINRGNGNVALQAANGQYVCAEGGGGGAVVANRNAIGAWETFKLIDLAVPVVPAQGALQAANGQYVCAEGSGGGVVVANRNAIGAWETFKLIDRGNGNVALQAANGQYVCAEGGGGGAVVANRNAIGAWETFKLIPR